MLAGLTHDLKAPLRRITTFGGMAKVQEDPTDTINRIIREAKAGYALVEDVLSFLQDPNTGLQLQDLNIAEIVRSRIRTQETELRERVKNQVSEARILGNQEWTCRIIDNLLSNALKYSEEDVIVTAHDEGTHIRVSVEDTGQGIPEDQFASVFASFNRGNQTETESGSHGVGLYGIHQLVTMMRGEMWFETATEGDEQGTIFHVTLPKPKQEIDTGAIEEVAAGETSADPEAVDPAETLKDKRILLIDDSKIDRMAFERCLQKILDTQELSNLVLVSSKDEALKAIEEASQSFDIVVCDWRMPSVDGHEAIQAVHEALEAKGLPRAAYIASSTVSVADDPNFEQSLFDGELPKDDIDADNLAAKLVEISAPVWEAQASSSEEE